MPDFSLPNRRRDTVLGVLGCLAFISVGESLPVPAALGAPLALLGTLAGLAWLTFFLRAPAGAASVEQNANGA